MLEVSNAPILEAESIRKDGSAQLASPRSVTPERTQTPDHGPSRTPALPAGFDFTRIPVHGKTPVGIQTKLTIGLPGDALEHEADRVAGQVMRMPQPMRSQAQVGASEHRVAPAAQVQTKSSHTGDSGGLAAPPIVHDVLRSPGQPLDAATRAFMEPRFGHDFSKVRVHADAKSAEAALSISARAFTSNYSVVFGAGEYASRNSQGRALLAHELTHVVQQAGSGQPAIQRQEKDKDAGKKPSAEKVYGPFLLPVVVITADAPSPARRTQTAAADNTRVARAANRLPTLPGRYAAANAAASTLNEAVDGSVNADVTFVNATTLEEVRQYQKFVNEQLYNIIQQGIRGPRDVLTSPEVEAKAKQDQALKAQQILKDQFGDFWGTFFWWTRGGAPGERSPVWDILPAAGPLNTAIPPRAYQGQPPVYGSNLPTPTQTESTR
jgi:hypothetical protein